MGDLLAFDADGEGNEVGDDGRRLAVVHTHVDDQVAARSDAAVAHHRHIGASDADEVERLFQQGVVLQSYLDIGNLAAAVRADMFGARGDAETGDKAAVVFEILVVLYLDTAFTAGVDAVISKPGARVTTAVVLTDEELAIAVDTYKIVTGQQ